MTIPGFGPITASAMAATIQDTSGFASPREFAAFLGLTPKQNSSGSKRKLGRISKMGNRNLRKLLVVGAHAVLYHRKPHTDPLRMWAKKLIDKKPFKLVAVALAPSALASASVPGRRPKPLTTPAGRNAQIAVVPGLRGGWFKWTYSGLCELHFCRRQNSPIPN
jgi:Transposase IS116/IS110/IS902 family